MLQFNKVSTLPISFLQIFIELKDRTKKCKNSNLNEIENYIVSILL